MELKKWLNGTVAKYNNKRAVVIKGEEDFQITFKKLKEDGDEESTCSFFAINGKVTEFGFRLTKESAIALACALISELEDEI